MTAPHREPAVARRSGDPTVGLIRRVLLVCLLIGAGSVVAVLLLRGGADPVVQWLSPLLLVVIVAFAWVVLRQPRATIAASRLVLTGLELLWLVTMVSRLRMAPEDGGGWDSLFPTTFMGFALFVVIGFLVFGTRLAAWHAGAVLVAVVGAGLVALRGEPEAGPHSVDLVRYAVYLGVLAAMVYVLSRTKESAARAFQVAEHASAEAASMREMAYRDPLTGAANRRRLEDELAYQGRVVGSGLDVAMVYLDLDRFKTVNDELGHAVGDRVLIAVAAVLDHQVRSGDLVARPGGEEFVVVAPGMAPADAREMAERLRTALPGAVEGETGVRVTASFGVTALRAHEDPAAALGRVDALMYRAKHAGRDRVAGDEDLADVPGEDDTRDDDPRGVPVDDLH
ncbi:MAG TPA: GGDEF domain-containing protein [Cellulomonas sp.]